MPQVANLRYRFSITNLQAALHQLDHARASAI